jgi:hypothetical protein
MNHSGRNERDITSHNYYDEAEIPQRSLTRNREQEGWTPLFLRRRTLLLFAGVFAMLLTVLEVLRKLSRDKQGFGPVGSSKHFLWTYIPAAGESSYYNEIKETR